MKMNRIISGLLIISLSLSFCVFVTADNPESLTLGDVTGNGTINAVDALEILQYSVGKRDSFSAETTSGGTSGYYPMIIYDSLSDFTDWIQALEVRPETKDFIDEEVFDYIHPEYYSGMIEDDGYYIPTIQGMTIKKITVLLAQIIYAFEDEQGNVIVCSYVPRKNTEIYITDQTTEMTVDNITYYVNLGGIDWIQYGYQFRIGPGRKETGERTVVEVETLPGLATWNFVNLSLDSN